MRIKSIIMALCAAIIGICGARAEDGGSAIQGLATFTADGVNLRQEPSTYSPYLVYSKADIDYFDPDNIMWSNEIGGLHINGQYIQPDHFKLQGEKGMTLSVLGTEGDWVKLSYLGHDVWTMKKFLDIKPIVSPDVNAVSYGTDFNMLCLTGDTEGSPAVWYQLPGMDEDEGLMIGEKKGNTIVFDLFLPLMLRYDENSKHAVIDKDADSGILILTYGPAQKLGSFTDYEVLDVKCLTSEDIKAMRTIASKLEVPQVFVTTGKEFVMIPK